MIGQSGENPNEGFDSSLSSYSVIISRIMFKKGIYTF
jgi:hypothetical protein